MASAK